MLVSIEEESEIQTGDSKQQLIETVFNDVKEALIERLHLPTSTYRLQFNRFFTFQQARAQMDYFQRLGISDLYASPYFKARAESLHGYDIANHNELNPSIGTQEDYDEMVAEMRRRDMYQVLDMVPNHMGIGEEGNLWWMDVLENGRSSLYAPFFDIDWDPINTKLTNKVLLPVLGDQYGKVLENGELRVTFLPEEGRFNLSYYEHTFPINPRSYRTILSPNVDDLIKELGPESDAALEYQSILTALNHLPRHWEDNRAKVLERNREKQIIKRRLTTLCAADPRVVAHIRRNVDLINGTPGDPHSFDILDDLLERQPYRLSFWRVATEEINYRRFFDVNDLAAVRIDQPRVFEETHRMTMRLLREGKLHGLRIDHVDGLRDPAGYFRDLQRGYFLEVCRQRMEGYAQEGALGLGLAGANRAELEAGLLERLETEWATDPHGTLARPLYVVVEKILAHNETLPSDWAVYGTTGYEYTNAVNGLFVDADNQKSLDEIYTSFIGEKVRFADLVYESKKQIMRVSLSSEINILTSMLNQITQRDRHSRDFTLNSIRSAIREVIASFPVYRTYITTSHTEPDKRDQALIETAVARAKKRNPAADPTIFDFLRDVLLLKNQEELSKGEREARYNFVLKFQQVSGPVTAKGLEDTAFYVYNRLVSLNEVGGEPGSFGTSLAHFHRQQAERQRNWPYSILTTSTHDTKRSEDVRARINVLSEMPREWRAAVRRWARLNRKHKRSVEGQLAPSQNEEYFLYQNLLGVWPFESEISGQEYATLALRMQSYMRKAMNEAKVNTSWINPNEPYQAAVADFIAAILNRHDANQFLPDFMAFQKRIAHYGAFNSLSQALLKITSPGVPDIYQGNEIWDLSLVDPDNRRPVDYDLRRRLLDEVEKVYDAAGASALVEAKEDGRVKLLVTSRAINYRRANRALFENGAYTPLEAVGKHPECVIAYARTHAEQTAVVVAPRLMARLGKSGDLVTPTGEVWTGSFLPIPGAEAVQSFRNVLTGEVVQAREQNGSVGLAMHEVLAAFPVALLDRISF